MHSLNKCMHQWLPVYPPGHTELPQLAVPKISGGLRSVTITWTPPPLTTSGVAVYQYNLYYMPGPASAFSQRRAQRLPVKPLKGTQATLPNLEPVVEYSVAVTYVVVKRGREPTYWEQESAPSPVAIARSAPDAQSKLQQRQGAGGSGTLSSC